MNYLELPHDERLRLFYSEKSSELIYQLLTKHLGYDPLAVRELYLIEVDFGRMTITITGESQDIYELWTYLTRFDLNFESVSQGSLRVDISKFLNRIK